MISGIKAIMDLVILINDERSKKNMTHLQYLANINYLSDTGPVDFATYTTLLKKHIPQLWHPDLTLITEFGRSFSGTVGWTVSKVEYTKTSANSKIVVIHCGADLMLRMVYQPEKWMHRISVFDENGETKNEKSIPQTIAGPLCFVGDILVENVEIPLINRGDHVVIHDTGAYTLSMWSRYNSRQAPAVYGYLISKNGNVDLTVLKEKESVDAVLKFWS